MGKCLEYEKICDMESDPVRIYPGVYWKPNRKFKLPLVSIDVLWKLNSTQIIGNAIREAQLDMAKGSR